MLKLFRSLFHSQSTRATRKHSGEAEALAIGTAAISSVQDASTSHLMHVCIKVPPPKSTKRAIYERCADREQWVVQQLRDEATQTSGVYAGRPKNDGGWYLSPTVKAGSLFANPYTLKEFTLEESLANFRAYIEARCRAAPSEIKECVVERRLAQERVQYSKCATSDGAAVMTPYEIESKGKSVAHLQLCVVGEQFKELLRGLHGKRLGCFCDEADPCHAKVLVELSAKYQKEWEEGGEQIAAVAAVEKANGDVPTTGGSDGGDRKKRKRREDGEDEAEQDEDEDEDVDEEVASLTSKSFPVVA